MHAALGMLLLLCSAGFWILDRRIAAYSGPSAMGQDFERQARPKLDSAPGGSRYSDRPVVGLFPWEGGAPRRFEFWISDGHASLWTATHRTWDSRCHETLGRRDETLGHLARRFNARNPLPLTAY